MRGIFREHQHMRVDESDRIDRVHTAHRGALSVPRGIESLEKGALRKAVHLIALSDDDDFFPEHLSPVSAVGHIRERIIARLIRKEINFRDKLPVILLHHETQKGDQTEQRKRRRIVEAVAVFCFGILISRVTGGLSYSVEIGDREELKGVEHINPAEFHAYRDRRSRRTADPEARKKDEVPDKLHALGPPLSVAPRQKELIKADQEIAEHREVPEEHHHLDAEGGVLPGPPAEMLRPRIDAEGVESLDAEI